MLRLTVLVLVLVCLATTPAVAIPTLQLYIEGSTYDTTTESWVITAYAFKLWVLGNVSQWGTIEKVMLTAAFPVGLSGSVSISETKATWGLLPDPGDPSTPGAPVLETNPSSTLTPPSGNPNDPSGCGSNGVQGTYPCMSNYKALPPHGEYGPGIQWVEFLLGNFTLTDSPIGDYVNSPPSSFPSTGQINAYDVTVAGFPEGTEFHFDAFDHIEGGNHARVRFAPFSHDGTAVPEPSSLLLLAAGTGALALLRRRGRS